MWISGLSIEGNKAWIECVGRAANLAIGLFLILAFIRPATRLITKSRRSE